MILCATSGRTAGHPQLRPRRPRSRIAAWLALICPECGTQRTDPSHTCPACGAPPVRKAGDKRATEEEVRGEDLEPYVTLRYIARLFKILAVLMVVMLVGEVVTGVMADGTAALMT